MLGMMDRFDAVSLRLVVSHFVPVELQRRRFHTMPIFSELAERAFKPIPGGAQQVHPWVGWRGLSTYLDCIAYADRSARDLPRDKELELTHVTPGQFHSVMRLATTPGPLRRFDLAHPRACCFRAGFSVLPNRKES